MRLFGLVIGAAALAGLAVISFLTDVPLAGVAFTVGSLYTALSAASYAYTMGRGRRRVWEGLLDLEGDELVLDLGGSVPTPGRNVRVSRRGPDVVAEPGALPFQDDSFDLVVSGGGLPEGAAVEALRVVRPGGRLLLADRRDALDHEKSLRERGVSEVRRRDLGWRYWYGGPWSATWLVEARKPGSG